MVNLLIIQMRVPLQDFIDDTIVGLERSEGVLLLHEIKTYGFTPVEFAHCIEELLVVFRFENFHAKENKTDRKIRMFLFYFFIDLIYRIHIGFFFVLFDKVTFRIILFESAGKGSKFDAVVAIFDEF